MRIIVMSDSHGLTSAVCRIIEMNIGHADMFIHLGDGEKDVEAARSFFPDADIRAVSGNCDSGGAPSSMVIDAEGIRIFCAHGHRFFVGGGTETLRSVARDNDCRIALFGHTHIRHESACDGIMLLNPGSCACPRDGKSPSFASIDITDEGIVMGIFDLKR